MSKKIKVAIVGRPNVGKSALFNRICGKRIAIVDEAEGVTRDRLYAQAECFGTPFEVIDTGGINPRSPDPLGDQIRQQAEIAIAEADTLVMVVDGRVGITDLDEELAHFLKKREKPLILAVNKIDHPSFEECVHTFYALGIPEIISTSATQGHHIAELLERTLASYTNPQEDFEIEGIKLSIIGRPNVGKSTLINTLLSENRCLASPRAGTTRDSVDIPFTFQEKPYVLIDTAGIRRKKAEHDVVDKFAAMRTERAIKRSDISLLVIDAREGLTTQEKRIATQIEAAGKGCVILLNKWDLVKGFRMEHATQALAKESPFLAHCPLVPISAKTGRNLETIFPHVDSVFEALTTRLPTHQLNTFVEKAMQLYHPPMLLGKRLRVYYTTQIGTHPPRFLLFVNNPDLMTKSYQRYLSNQFRHQYTFLGSPLSIEIKKSPQKKSRS